MMPTRARRSGDHDDAGGPDGAGLETGASQEAIGERQPCPEGALVLKLVIAATDPLTGTVEPPGQAPGIAFHGWIDQMGTISDLAARHGEDPDRLS
jgi:hypothetical protein